MKAFFNSLFKSDAAAGTVLLICAVLAMIIANSPWAAFYTDLLYHTTAEVRLGEGPLHIVKPLQLWINDGLMAVFFFYVGLEIKREWHEGFLTKPDQRWLPIAAAVGGMAIPGLVYAFFNYDNPENLAGWAIPAATDIAFALGIYALVGKYLPTSLKVFLLALAVLDDLGAIIIIALFYTDGLAPHALLGAGFFLAGLVLLNRLRINTVSWYVVFAVGLWFCVLKSGVHATIAGVVAAMFVPLSVPGERRSLLKQLEHDLKPLVAFFIMPVFAFANAGVSLEGVTPEILLHPVTLGIIGGLFVGKQVGICGAAWLMVKLRLCKMPEGCTWRHIWGMSMLAGIGFTMSLFIATLAFADHTHHMVEVKVGIMVASVLAATCGLLVLSGAHPAAEKPAQTATRRPQPKR
jgi:NhaA family Na+:H+ antiporter